MHYRSNELKFQTSKDVKRELEKLNGTYSENLENDNPHTSIYKILDTTNEFNNLNKSK